MSVNSTTIICYLSISEHTTIHQYNFMVLYDSPRHLFTVIKHDACAGHRSFSHCHSFPSRQCCFITVTRAQAKGQLREQSIHLVSPLLGSCGAGEGQSEAEGISKRLCLLDLSVTLCSLSLPFYFFLTSLSSLSPLSSLSLSLSHSQYARQLPSHYIL